MVRVRVRVRDMVRVLCTNVSHDGVQHNEAFVLEQFFLVPAAGHAATPLTHFRHFTTAALAREQWTGEL